MKPAPPLHRVLVTVGQYHPDLPAGANRLAYDEACYLAARGVETWMLVQDLAGDKPEYEECEGIRVLRYRVPAMVRLDPRRMWAHRNAVRTVLARHLDAVDAIHGHAPLCYSAACDSFPAARRAFSIHSPVTMEMALNWSGSSFLLRTRRLIGLPLLRRLERQCIEQSDAASADSRYTCAMLEQIHGHAAAAKVHVVPGWADVDRFLPVIPQAEARLRLGWPQDEPVFFTLRRLVSRMGLETLLRAAANLRQAGWEYRLMIGGSGPLRPALEQAAAELRLGGCVQFLGRIEDSVLPLAYQACDAFILPTAALECFGLIAVEAMAAGRPVLATPVGAIPEMLQPIEPRWLARSSQEKDIVALLQDFLAGRLPAHDSAELCRIMEREYSGEKVIPRLVALFDDKGGGQ